MVIPPTRVMIRENKVADPSSNSNLLLIVSCLFFIEPGRETGVKNDTRIQPSFATHVLPEMRKGCARWVYIYPPSSALRLFMWYMRGVHIG